MSIHAVLRDVLAMEKLSFPKGPDLEQLKQTFGNLLEDHGETWRVKCSHRCSPPVSEAAVRQAEEKLGFALPAQLHTFLRATNGAELFVFPGFDTPFVLYKILGTEELIAQQRKALEVFHYVLGTDTEFKDVQLLNYVAFCDVNDGNYLGIVLEGPERGKVFFLDREGCFRPYSERDAEMYYTLADSLENWLVLVRDTGGCDGQDMIRGFYRGEDIPY